MKKVSFIYNVILTVALTLALVVLVDVFASLIVPYFSSSNKPEKQYQDDGPGILYDDNTGLVYYPPNSTRRQSLTVNGKTYFDVHINFDEFSRRMVPGKPAEKPLRFAVFFGGSHTYGWGLNDNETLPYHFSSIVPDFQSYNYGFSGYGTHHMMAKIESADLRQEIIQEKGYFFYLYNDFHMGRVAGHPDYITWSKGAAPCYRLVDSKSQQSRANRIGTFESEFPIITQFYRFSGKSWLLSRTLSLFYGRHYSETTVRLTCALVRQSKDMLRNLFADSEFIVLIGEGSMRARDPFVTDCLDRYSIKYIDFRSIPMVLNFRRTLAPLGIDLHPTAEANRVYAEKIVRDLGL